LGAVIFFGFLIAWPANIHGGTIREVYAAYDGPRLLGYVFGAFPKGYGGEMKVTVGVYSTGKISGVTVGENKETPGLGSKAAEAGFIGQFLSKTVNEGLRIVKQKPAAANEIEAISGATISSKAVTDAVSDSVELTANLIMNGVEK
jgi:electron transport complex protein RnfG